MKTLKQWFDGLSTEAQCAIRDNCDWFDMNEPDYYRKSDLLSTDELMKNIFRVNKYSSEDKFELFLSAFLTEFKYHSTDEEFMSIITALRLRFVEEDDDDSIWYGLPKRLYQLMPTKELQKEWFLLSHYSRRKCLGLFDQLYLVEDYDKIPEYIDMEKCSFEYSVDSDVLMEIFGKDLIMSIYRDNENKLYVNYGKPSAIFDELFFCENGWNEQQKKSMLKKLYVSNWRRKQTDSDDLISFKDFIERIVCVDKKYLRFMYDIIDRVPAVGNKIYDEKKPDEDLKGDERGDQLYRYNKTIRKLAKLANICSRKSLSKVNGKAYKELSPLIKIYGYDFNTLYDVIMDEQDEIEEALNN